MGLPMVAHLAKFKLLCNPSHTALSPAVTVLVWPFMLKLCFSFKLVRQAYSDLVRGTRLFLFQLGRIAFDRGEVPADHVNGNGHRFERALRLVNERLAHLRTPQGLRPSDDDHSQDSLAVLSMFAL